jgi:hypothetical protein
VGLRKLLELFDADGTVAGLLRQLGERSTAQLANKIRVVTGAGDCQQALFNSQFDVFTCRLLIT